MTDLMDERLNTAARRWQGEQSPPPVVPLDRLDESLPGHVPWRPLLAAAVAVIVVGGGAVALSRSPGERALRRRRVRPPLRSSGQRARRSPGGTWPRDIPTFAREHGQVVTPFDRVSASGTISGRLHPGDTLRFTAVLESSTDLPLDPCPDFNIAFGRHSWHTWQLNCAQVPYRDGAGRPFLPAFRDVRFEMKVTVPDDLGEQKVLWTLNGPQQMPGFYGLVRVTAG